MLGPSSCANQSRRHKLDSARVYSAEIVPVFKFVAKPDPDAKGTDAHYLVLLDGALEFKVPEGPHNRCRRALPAGGA